MDNATPSDLVVMRTCVGSSIVAAALPVCIVRNDPDIGLQAVDQRARSPSLLRHRPRRTRPVDRPRREAGFPSR